MNSTSRASLLRVGAKEMHTWHQTNKRKELVLLSQLEHILEYVQYVSALLVAIHGGLIERVSVCIKSHPMLLVAVIKWLLLLLLLTLMAVGHHRVCVDCILQIGGVE